MYEELILHSKPLQLDHLDHLVLTVGDIEVSCKFYSTILGMKLITFGDNRKALIFGQQKINLHQYQHEFEPKAKTPTPGSADICLITKQPLADWIDHFKRHDITLIEGPVPRTGAIGSLQSIYLYDPDGNLIEISVYC